MPPLLRHLARAALGVVLVVLAACTGGSGGSGKSTTSTTLAASASLEEIAAAIGCTKTAPLDDMYAPIRSNRATAGLACETPSGGVHLFDRAPEGPVSDRADSPRGTTEAIESGLHIQSTPDRLCDVSALIGAGYFAVSDSPAVLEAVARIAGHVEVRPTPASPTVSYLEPPCRTVIVPPGAVPGH